MNEGNGSLLCAIRGSVNDRASCLFVCMCYVCVLRKLISVYVLFCVVCVCVGACARMRSGSIEIWLANGDQQGPG